MTYRIQKLPDMERVHWPSTRLIDSNEFAMSEKIQTQRHYIDPWDLENIAYISRNMRSSLDDEDEDLNITASPSPAGEPAISTTFYYIPGSSRDDCAGMEEELFYNTKYETITDDDQPSSYYTDVESSSTERNSSCGSSTVSTLQLHTPGFGVRASGRRSIVLPKPVPHIEFPAPPSRPPTTHTYVSHDHHRHHHSYSSFDNSYSSLSPTDEAGHYDCYECLMTNENHIPLYVTKQQQLSNAENLYQQYPPNNFGLSKKGLLQIDYSFNWNNLHRFIAK